jgi:CheY-like chemotaxis protein
MFVISAGEVLAPSAPDFIFVLPNDLLDDPKFTLRQAFILGQSDLRLKPELGLAARALRARGFSVMLAGDGAEALRLLETHREPLDLLVTDVVMPNMDGRELADRLRARMPGLKVLFLSGYMDDALLRRGVFEANETLLLKPFTPSTLAQRVREVLDFV